MNFMFLHFTQKVNGGGERNDFEMAEEAFQLK